MGDTVLVVFVCGFLVAMFMIWRAGDHDISHSGTPSRNGHDSGRSSRHDGCLVENPYSIEKRPNQHEHWRAGYIRGRVAGLQDLYPHTLGLAAGLLEAKTGRAVALNPFDDRYLPIDVEHFAYFDRESARRGWEVARQQYRDPEFFRPQELGMCARLNAIVFLEAEQANPHDRENSPREHELWQTGCSAMDDVSLNVANAFEHGVFWGQVNVILGRKRENPYSSTTLAKRRDAWNNGYLRCFAKINAPRE